MQELDSVVSDILVIGAGGCGLMAALVAAKKGVRVLLLEKTDKPGGGTAFSSKGIRAAGSRRQRELSIADSPELYAEDILRRNNNESDRVLTRRLTETSGRVADFLTDMAGIEFQIGEFAFGHGALRSHSWKADKTITDFLFETVEREKNIQVRFSTPVLSLQQETRRRGNRRGDKRRRDHSAKNYSRLGRLRRERGVVGPLHSQSAGHSFSRSPRQHRRRHQDGFGDRRGDGKHGRLPAVPRIHRSGKTRGGARGGSIRRHHGRRRRQAFRRRNPISRRARHQNARSARQAGLRNLRRAYLPAASKRAGTEKPVGLLRRGATAQSRHAGTTRRKIGHRRRRPEANHSRV